VKEKVKMSTRFIKGNFSQESNLSQIKNKAIPLQVWRGPEGSRRLRIPDFKTIGT
jgi:hypothetical protein